MDSIDRIVLYPESGEQRGHVMRHFRNRQPYDNLPLIGVPLLKVVPVLFKDAQNHSVSALLYCKKAGVCGSHASLQGFTRL